MNICPPGKANALIVRSSASRWKLNLYSVWPALVLAMIFSPISVLLTTPFIRPFHIGRIIFTYLIPVVPVLILWDGVVSSLRTYSVDEMNVLVSNLNNKENFNWEVGRVKSGPTKILYLLGTKK